MSGFNKAKIIALLVFLIIPVLTLAAAYAHDNELAEKLVSPANSTQGLYLERVVRDSFPFGKQLLSLRNRINLGGGRREIVTQAYGMPWKQNGIFISENGLMKNIDAPVSSYVDLNIEKISEFAEEMRQERVQTYFMLIPTSGAILQQNLPSYADSVMVNQRSFIDGVYSRLSGSTVTVDAYSPLFAMRDRYVYYRTENNLTSLGGYQIYSALISRLGLGQAQIRQFDVDYIAGSFYGDLSAESGYTSIAPDTVSLLRYSPLNRRNHEFMVQHISAAGHKTYHTLYPAYAPVNGTSLDIFLGGLSPITDISASTGYSARILLFADKTAISYAPLLANNCERLTIANLSSYNFMLDEIDIKSYDKIIFAFSVESFMQMPEPSRAASHFIDVEWAELLAERG